MKKIGTFDIINDTPIVFAYGFPKPHENGYLDDLSVDNSGYKIAMKIYEKSRKEWQAGNLVRAGHWWVFPKSLITIRKEQQVQFIETESSTKDKRGKCEIIKIN